MIKLHKSHRLYDGIKYHINLITDHRFSSVKYKTQTANYSNYCLRINDDIEETVLDKVFEMKRRDLTERNAKN